MSRRISILTLAALALFVMARAGGTQDPLPKNPAPTCTVAQADFAKWFANGMIQKNGLVNPADSLDFAPSGLCDFYKWAWQMFLWATSPQHTYGGNSFVFNSPVFYDVSPPGAPPNCERTLAVNTGLAIKTFGVFRAQVNRKGLAIRLGPNGTIIRSEEGQATGDVLMAQDGSLVYYGLHVNDVSAFFLSFTVEPGSSTFR
jgi:hypothetical protein